MKGIIKNKKDVKRIMIEGINLNYAYIRNNELRVAGLDNRDDEILCSNKKLEKYIWRNRKAINKEIKFRQDF